MELAVLLALLGAARALSTCRSLDLEAARRKRIEAVRGQILSKLRLPAPPAEPPPWPLPEEVRALYNSTQELLRQRAKSRPPDDPDEYYAKELHRFPMEPPGEGPLEHWRPTSHSTFFIFNTSRVRAEIGHEALLHRAELRMLRQGSSAENQGAEQRLELYQGYGNASWRYLHGRSVQVTKEEEWLWFDVTDVVKQWLSSSESLGMFKLSVHCPCEQGPGATNNMRITIEGRRRRTAACGHCTSISVRICSGSGSTSPRATWPTSAWGPVPTSGALTPSTPRWARVGGGMHTYTTPPWGVPWGWQGGWDPWGRGGWVWGCLGRGGGCGFQMFGCHWGKRGGGHLGPGEKGGSGGSLWRVGGCLVSPGEAGWESQTFGSPWG
ncbi:transforming growth factor beta-1 proprotein isoform X3 [Accipiter gentilis]|uniref:transforming growth factor beta-1 proprotein isoform X3 n=1 Tax=Astur gentilis TaxID=8957 RepID=UPI00210F24C6|nr:transforming growth factor beta-1 proprotein isoform X3 [Accipiter gentilis]